MKKKSAQGLHDGNELVLRCLVGWFIIRHLFAPSMPTLPMPTSNPAYPPLPTRFRLGEWIVDSDLCELQRGEEIVPLPGLSLSLLLALARRPNELSDSESLINEVWQREVVSDATLQQRIKLLRRALGDDSGTPRYIATIRGRGYRLLLQPEALPAQTTPSNHHALAQSSAATMAAPSSLPAAPPAPEPGPTLTFAELDSNTALPAPPKLTVPKWLWFALASLLCLLLAGIWWWKAIPKTAPLDPKRLVVLPLQRASSDMNDDLFADGLTEQLIWNLARTPGLQVIARSSAMAYKDHPRPLPELARALTVGSILQGQIQRNGGQIHITLKLIDVSNMGKRWEKRYDLSNDNLTGWQAMVAEEVASILGAHLDKQPQSPANGDAYTLYLQGRQRYLRYSQADNDAAITLFRASLARSPTYAHALAGLADAYAQAVYQFGAPSAQMDEALRYADAAIALAPQLAEAHKARGLALDMLGRRSAAIQSYRNASKLNPGYADAVINEAILQWEGGHLSEAYQLSKRAISLDPLEPYGYLINAQTLTTAGFHEAAELLLDRVQQHAPENAMAHTILCAHWSEVSNRTRAKAECAALLKRHPDYAPALTLTADIALQEGEQAIASQRYQHAIEQGVGADARYAKIRMALLRPVPQAAELMLFVNELKRKIEQHDEDPEQQMQLAMLYAGLGQVHEGMAALEAAVAGGYSNRHTLKNDPHLAVLRKHANFARLMGQLEGRLQNEHKRMQGLISSPAN